MRKKRRSRLRQTSSEDKIQMPSGYEKNKYEKDEAEALADELKPSMRRSMFQKIDGP